MLKNTIKPGGKPLPLRRRPDLIVQPQRVGLRQRWAVKDPIALNYFHLGEEEWFLLEQLDGVTSLAEIKSRYDLRFAPRHVTPGHLVEYCNRLHKNGLVLSERPGQGQVLRSRVTRQWQRTLSNAALNPLAIRFRGIDAEGILQLLLPIGRLLFHPIFVVAVLFVWAVAITLLVAQSGEIVQRLPALADYFQGHNVFWLLVAVCAVKVLHELGHGLACVNLGGECHEIGFMLLAFTPCLYCNVSDAWMMPNKWHRIVVSAAGMYVEFILAGICVFLWYFSAPGILNSICLNVILVSTISTLLFNGNPLLRYDGYYILADLMEIPNLFEQSRTAMWSRLEQWLAGSTRRPESLDASRAQLMLYGVASATYRAFAIGLILWVLHGALSANNLRPMGDLLVVITLCGVSAPFVWSMARFSRRHAAGNSVCWPRWGLLTTLLTTTAGILFCLPLPSYLRAPLVLEATDAHYLSVPFDGQLVEAVPLGSAVTEGSVVARLENPLLRRDLMQARAKASQLRQHLENLSLRANFDATAFRQVNAATTAVHAAEQRVTVLQDRIDRLRVTAPIAGVVIPAAFRTDIKSAADSELPFWTGTPLDEQNRSCHLKSGELLCLIGDPNRLEAQVLIEQGNIDLVQVGARVRIRVDQLPGKVFWGQIHELSQGQVRQVPQALVQEIPVKHDSHRARQPRETSYYARVEFDEPPLGARHGSGGFAKIVTRWEPIGIRLCRCLSRTFQFRL